MDKGIEMIIQEAISKTMDRVRRDPKITMLQIEQRIKEMTDREIIEMHIYDYDDIHKQTYKDAITMAFEKTGEPSKAGTMLSTAMFFRWADEAYANEYMTTEEYKVVKDQIKTTARILAKYINTEPLRQYQLDKIRGTR